MYKVLVSAPYMHKEKGKVSQMFNKYDFDLTWIAVEERLEEEDLLKVISEYDAIVCGDDKITEKVIDAATKLKTIIKWGTGIDSINVEYALTKNISVKRTLDAFTEPVADTTLAMMLADVRSLFKNDNIVKSGGWGKPQGYTLAEKTVGIIGLGNTGRAVAKRLVAFGSKVLACDIMNVDEKDSSRLNVEITSIDKIFSECDIISIHCDLNDSSFHLLDEDAFLKMTKKPFIINCARGPIINEKQLICAIEKGFIRGAGLDVFEEEPLSLVSPLRKMDNVITSCHNSNSSPDKWDKVHLNSIKMLAKELGVE